jgi:uncharacterized protein (TIGR02594 family)
MSLKMEVSAVDLAQRFVGLKEIPGQESNPQVLAMLRLDAPWPTGDEVPWCSAFVNYIAWLLRLPRSKALSARSWLGVGYPTLLQEATVGFDVVILSRGEGNQPGPEVLNASGHVGFFMGLNPPISDPSLGQQQVLVLGGNQADSVSVGHFSVDRVLGVRRLH